jgi:hypothetical protein
LLEVRDVENRGEDHAQQIDERDWLDRKQGGTTVSLLGP